MLKQKLENIENLIKERFAQYLSIHCGNSTEDILRYLDFNIYAYSDYFADVIIIEVPINDHSEEYQINWVKCKELSNGGDYFGWTFRIPNVLDDEIFETWIKENKVEKL